MNELAAVDRAVEAAYGYLGLPYVFAGGDLTGPTGGGFDRAGFIRRVVYAAAGTDIGRTLDTQLNNCAPLASGERADPGDVLFWIDPSNRMQKCYHQAFYTGLMTVISAVPRDLAEPGTKFDARQSRGILGSVFHEQEIDVELLTAHAPAESGPYVIIARPPYCRFTA
ncbi:NlpC/P60 family protein [Mycobacteroides abscessus]|uniref:NlpC/P60 family protein n=1 Tax=Mycobacteroides abscessus TaxID=36809 RepID=UPI000929447F|nr:NlpC/P60 family protein [Mycobacteroides abscessus]MBL3752294.1 C40 family peptidase [Mycobacteroides abscessus subsp. massiliense]QCO29041.1 peptidoglycan endopeptidase [Mycobacteroides abscessus subsp. massiliense]SHY28982.1 cell wall-associated hydrolase, invasion-associated protein [Mycobacteroides abscessus subsp. abscessus]SID71281.1 cell wall-associated hydrolase, invasion-associated protein [Mycobacteroides abscessus subsp. abscessus]SIK23010.1 cell wall-associated hydrolase, invasi